MAKTLQLHSGIESQAGTKPENQDAVGFCLPEEAEILSHKGAVAVLADGVSSSEAAKQASATAVKTFINDYYSTPDTWSTKHACQQIMTALNAWLYKQGDSTDNALRGWVTTFDAVIFKSNTAYIVHVGDSRVYRLRDGELSLLTKDHVTVLSAQRSYLSRSLGSDSVLQVDFKEEPLQEGDLFLMTSDGVHEFVPKKAIIEILQTPDLNTQQKSERLVAIALVNGSDDNVSAQVIEVKSLPKASKEEVFQKLTELPFPPDLAPGMKIDGYEILQELNASERSQIYLAKDTVSGKTLVLKTPSPNYMDDPWYLDGFVREEWIGQRLNHPGLMKAYQSGRKKHFLYFTTEYIQGQTLTQWMADNPEPSLQAVRSLVSQLVQALRALHRLDVIHQDLKPDNIMITQEGRVKIIDFGAVKALGLAEVATVLERQHPEGTLNYTAPEYMMGEQGSTRSDIFSLGVITYQMLTGQLPYKEKQVNQFQLRSYSHMQYRSARSFRKEIPDWVDGALKKACEPDPSKRYGLLSEFEVDLKKPNPDFLKNQDSQPLIERNPVRFWQGVSFVLLLTNLLVLWVDHH